MITSVPGVSPYYPGGLVTYSPESKANLLGVPEAMLKDPTARSAPRWPARWPGESASGSGPTLASPSPGSPGPSTDDPRHPVGLVYLGLSTVDEVRTRKLELGPEQPRDVIQPTGRQAGHQLGQAGPRSINPMRPN